MSENETVLAKLAEISTDVKYLRGSFDEHKEAIISKLDAHIEEDKSITKEFLRPLWEESQRRVGAAKMAMALYATISGIVALTVTWITGTHR